MGRHHSELREAGADVVAVFQYRAEPAYHFCRKRGVPFECLGDAEREGYHAVGLERGGAGEVIGPQLIPGFIRAARQGALPGIPKGDTAQRPGTFVVATDGTVVYSHYNKDSSDNPDTGEIVAVVRDLASDRAG